MQQATTRKWSLLAVAWGMSFLCWAGAEEEAIVHPALNEEKGDAPVGKRPYELDWAGRTEPNHPQLVDFEDLTGWQVRCFDGAEARLIRSQRELLFGEHTGRVVYAGRSARSRFVLEPPEPIAIPEPFTGVNLWVRGNNWGWINPPKTARVGVRALVRDAKDQDYSIPLGSVNFDYWSLMHATCVSPDGESRHYESLGEGNDGVIDFPARFLGVEVSGCASSQPAQLYCDALSFYKIEYPALEFEPIPSSLQWPTTPNTILPTVDAKLKTTATLKGEGPATEWTATVSDGEEAITCGFDPSDGTLSGVTAGFRGQQFYPCWKGGIVFEVDGKPVRPGDPDAEVACLGVEQAKGLVLGLGREESTTYRFELKVGDKAFRYSYAFLVKGKSLVVDVACEGDEAGNGHASYFDIGLARGLNDAKAVFFPYLTYGEDWPRVVCSADPEKPIFLLSLLDYFNSDASELFGAPRLHEEGCLAYTGGAAYKPTTAGKRNPLRERLFINVSGDVHEVLPNIPTARCDTGAVAREYVWRNIGRAFQNELLSKYQAHGIDKFIACHHEVGWREGGESFTLRDRPAPGIGEEALAEYGAFVRGLGYRFGTYTNYVDFAPVNANWDENDVCLDPQGRWQTAWPRCYALKPLRAVEKEADYAPRINERYGTTAQYCDVHTAYKPWGRTDYDARTPGAGMFRTQYDAFARLLQNESKAHKGPVFSEGNYHWFYAGIVDGNYATIVPYGQGWELPQLVDFDLLKMHPKMTDFGMGMPLMYFGKQGEWREDDSRLSPWFDRFHTATIAFGHIGFLADDWGFDGTLKSYYLLQALQQRYAMIPVESIGYFDGERIVDTSMALMSDAYTRNQVFVEYENGLEVWCNLSFDDDWPLSVAGMDYVLPPTGFLAYKEGDILAYSAEVDGWRHEYVQCADYAYVDTRGHVVRTPVVTTRGAVAVKPDGEDGWWIIPATESDEVTLALSWLLGDEKALVGEAHPEGEAPDSLAERVSDLAGRVAEIPGRIAEIPGRIAEIPGRLPGLDGVFASRALRFVAAAYDGSGQELGAAAVRLSDESVTVVPWEPEGEGGPRGEKRPVKYHLRTESQDAEKTGAWHFDVPRHQVLQGTTVPVTVSVEVPRGMDVSDAALAYGREIPESAEPVMDHAKLSRPEGGTVAVATVNLEVPKTEPYTRCWYRFWLTRTDAQPGEPRWLGLIAAPPFDIAFEPAQRPARLNETFPLVTRVKSNFAEPVIAQMTLRAEDLLEAPLQKEFDWAPGAIKELSWPLSIPEAPVVAEVTLHAECGLQTSETVAYVRTCPGEWVVARFTELPLERGQRLRGEDESPYDHAGTAALVHGSQEELAGQRLDSIFMHPPYKRGVGYCFATFDVTLPEGRPMFKFALGFRDGSTSEDGCVFSVVVTDGGKETEVFKERYALLGAWTERSADLGAFAGRTVAVKLIADVGPDDNSYSDWALWGAPRVVMDETVMRVEVLDERPLEEYGPPPVPLLNLKRDELTKIRSARLKMESAGVNTGPFASYVYFNGIEIGETPPSDSDTVWESGQIELVDAVLGSIVCTNRVIIKNPNRDYMKVRSVVLEFELEDGRTGSSMVALGPYCSADKWDFKEGVCVPLGKDLAEIPIVIPVE